MRMRLAASLARAWDAQGASQRLASAAMAGAIVVAALIVLVVVPLSDAIARARADLAHNRLVLDIARARVAESATLARAAMPPKTEPVRAVIDRALSQAGLKYAPVDERATEGPVRIVIADAPFDMLVRTLDTLAREDGIRLVEATIAARVDPGTVRAELALAR